VTGRPRLKRDLLGWRAPEDPDENCAPVERWP